MRLLYTVCLIFLSLLFLIPCVFAQSEEQGSTGGDETETQSAPDASDPIVNIQEQPYKYYYWPDEDLNNFGLSSMGSGKSGTTLGSSSERRSNLEVNAPGRPDKAQEDGPESPERSESETDSISAPEYGDDATGTPGGDSPAPVSDSPIYKWVDDEGTLHITNNIGDVPLEYQEDYYNREENIEE